MERRRSDPGHKRHTTRDTESAPAAPQSTDTACTQTVAHHTQQREVCTVTREYTHTCSQRTFKFRHLPGHQPCVVNAARVGRRGPRSTSVERRRSDPGHKRHTTRDTESAPAAPQSTDTACTLLSLSLLSLSLLSLSLSFVSLSFVSLSFVSLSFVSLSFVSLSLFCLSLFCL